jgi:hypothetical protein
VIAFNQLTGKRKNRKLFLLWKTSIIVKLGIIRIKFNIGQTLFETKRLINLFAKKFQGKKRIRGMKTAS